MAVDGGARPHDRIDIGNGHANPYPASRRWLSHRELVEVPGIVVVDRAPEKVAQVADGGIRLDGRSRDGVGLRHDR